MSESKRAAGFVVVRPAERGWRYLVLRAFRNWDFPKGRVEPGETLLETARRETREETSLDDLELRWGETFCDTERYAGGKVARFYVAISHEGDVHLPMNEDLGRPEHHEHRWTTYDEAHALLRPRLRNVLEWARTVIDSPK